MQLQRFQGDKAPCIITCIISLGRHGKEGYVMGWVSALVVPRPCYWFWFGPLVCSLNFPCCLPRPPRPFLVSMPPAAVIKEKLISLSEVAVVEGVQAMDTT